MVIALAICSSCWLRLVVRVVDEASDSALREEKRSGTEQNGTLLMMVAD